jgi:hypothetical protein
MIIGLKINHLSKISTKIGFGMGEVSRLAAVSGQKMGLVVSSL